MRINLYSIKRSSRVNGPGVRCVVWTQGCSLGCEGCFNSALLAFEKKISADVKKLAWFLASTPGDGLTVSGGEPFDQLGPLYALLNFYKKYCDKTIIIFTGYAFSELKTLPEALKTVLLADAVVSGRYKKGEQWNNKQLLLPTGRIRAREMPPDGSVELAVSGGSVAATGYPV